MAESTRTRSRSYARTYLGITPWYARLVLMAVAWGALSFGAVYEWAYIPLAAACVALGAWGLREAAVRGIWKPDFITVALAAAAVGIALQTIPLPYALFSKLAPSADAYLRTQFLLYQPGPHPLSLSPDDTQNALIIFAGLAVLFAGLVAVTGEVRLEGIMAGLIGLGVFLTIVAVVQRVAIDPEDPMVYGFWRPRQMAQPFGPFINRNHFAGWMVMAVPLAMGYSLALFQASDRPRTGSLRRWLLWTTQNEASRLAIVMFAVLAMGASVVISGSRSGMASLMGAVAVLVILAFLKGRRHVRRLAALYLALVAPAAIAWAGVGSIVARFSLSTNDLPGRISAWRDTLRIIADFPFFGVGVGAFGSAMLVYQSFDRRYLYRQAHNEYLELFAEGGLIVAIPIIIAAAFFLWRVARRVMASDEEPTRMWIRLGAVAGLAGIAAQSLVEFSLQMPGNAVLFVLLAAIAAHEPARRVRPDKS